jgi:hypothetical protein
MESRVSYNKQRRDKACYFRELLATDTDTDEDLESTAPKKLSPSFDDLNAALDAFKEKVPCTSANRICHRRNLDAFFGAGNAPSFFSQFLCVVPCTAKFIERRIT